MSEFTGERVIPGEVNEDLWAEHVARYAFAARYTTGKRALDIGCGTGYGTAEIAKDSITTFAIDVAQDAISYARTNYPLANMRLAQATATALPFRAASFDIITAFEVIEHLTDWRGMLVEARRVLRHNGLFLVSTPNKNYYAQSRSKDGPNPFHVHEFDYDEFKAALDDFFPQVTILLQNWTESIAITPAKEIVVSTDARIDSTGLQPQETHFFLAICSAAPTPELRGLLFLPRAANVLREREQHIHLLEAELEQSKQWLDDARWERDAMIALQAAQKHQLEESNRWALHMEVEWKATLERITRVQDELHAEQARAADVIADYARKVGELEDENRQQTDWALDVERRLTAKCDELAETVRLLDRAEATVIERTQWAQLAETRLAQLEAQLQMVRDSRWTKLGRAVGLGPRIDSR